MISLPLMSHLNCAADTVQVLAPGTWLRQRRQETDQVLYLESGSVLPCVEHQSQARHHLGEVSGPAWLDGAFALAAAPVCVDMQVIKEARVYAVEQAEFQRALAQLPEAAKALVLELAQAYCAQMHLTVSRLSQDAQARCAQWLLLHARPHTEGGLRVTFPQRKRSVAAQLGIAPETFSRVLRQLRERGFIAGHGSTFEVAQPGALELLAQA